MTSQRAPGPAVMDQDQVWQVINTQRLQVASLLEQLTPGEWRQPSLCAGWTVKDVSAHLTLQQLGLAGAIALMARWRGSLDRTIHDAACRRAAAWPTGQISAAIRDTAGSRRHNRHQPGPVHAVAATPPRRTQGRGIPAHRHRHLLVCWRRPASQRPDPRHPPGMHRPPHRPATTVRRRRPRSHHPSIPTPTLVTGSTGRSPNRQPSADPGLRQDSAFRRH